MTFGEYLLSEWMPIVGIPLMVYVAVVFADYMMKE